MAEMFLISNREFSQAVANGLRCVGHDFAIGVFVVFGNNSSAVMQKVESAAFTQGQTEFLAGYRIVDQVLVDEEKQLINSIAGAGGNECSTGI